MLSTYTFTQFPPVAFGDAHPAQVPFSVLGLGRPQSRQMSCPRNARRIALRCFTWNSRRTVTTAAYRERSVRRSGMNNLALYPYPKGKSMANVWYFPIEQDEVYN